MCHMGASDNNLFPWDCNELTLINHTESNANLLHCPSPTSTLVLLDDCVISWHHHLSVQQVEQFLSQQLYLVVVRY